MGCQEFERGELAGAELQKKKQLPRLGKVEEASVFNGSDASSRT
jgi:hypothetical protein